MGVIAPPRAEPTAAAPKRAAAPMLPSSERPSDPRETTVDEAAADFRSLFEDPEEEPVEGAAGADESVFTLQAIHRRKLPPTINSQTPDPECALDYLANEARESTNE